MDPVCVLVSICSFLYSGFNLCVCVYASNCVVYCKYNSLLIINIVVHNGSLFGSLCACNQHNQSLEEKMQFGKNYLGNFLKAVLLYPFQ